MGFNGGLWHISDNCVLILSQAVKGISECIVLKCIFNSIPLKGLFCTNNGAPDMVVCEMLDLGSKCQMKPPVCFL